MLKIGEIHIKPFPERLESNTAICPAKKEIVGGLK